MRAKILAVIFGILALNFYLSQFGRSAQFGSDRMNCHEAVGTDRAKNAIEEYGKLTNYDLTRMIRFLQKSGFSLQNISFHNNNEINIVFSSKEHSMACYNIFFPSLDGVAVAIVTDVNGKFLRFR